MKTFLIGSLIITIMLSGCKKIAAGITTNLSGTVMDDNRNVPLANLKVVVMEDKYKFTGDFSGELPINTSATATTDANGKYSVTFTTDGAGDQYSAILVTDSSYFNLNPVQKINVGGNIVAKFTAWKLSILKAHIIVKNNPGPNMSVTAGFNASSGVVRGANKDTTVSFQVAPNRPNGLTFGIQVPGNTYPSYLTQTITFSGDSSIYHQTFTVYPSTFIQL